MLRTMPRAISLVVRGNFGVGDVSVGINVDTASVPPGVGAGLAPVFVEAGKREQPLRISSRQYMMNMIICVRERWRIPCPSKNLSKLSHLKTPCVYACGGCQFASLQLASIQIINLYIAQNRRSSLSLYKCLVRRGKALGDLAAPISSQ